MALAPSASVGAGSATTRKMRGLRFWAMALNVVAAVIAIGVVTVLFRRGRLDSTYIETTGLYWHFVDLVWMFVFPLVYLLNAH